MCAQKEKKPAFGEVKSCTNEGTVRASEDAERERDGEGEEITEPRQTASQTRVMENGRG